MAKNKTHTVGRHEAVAPPKAKKPRKKRRVWLIVLICVLVVIIAAAVAALVFINSKLGLINYDDGKRKSNEPISTEDFSDEELDVDGLDKLDGVKLSDSEIKNRDDVFNILLLGTDEWTSDYSEDARADAIMMLSLDLDDYTAKLVSIERGTGVPILDGDYEGEYDWITHCFKYGGADLVMREVQECFRVDVDRYMRVNFNALVNVVDALGGIDVDLTLTEAEYLNASKNEEIYEDFPAQNFYWGSDMSKLIELHAGTNHLTGVMALAYARLRAIDSDWVRIERQRTVVQACMDSLKNANVSTLNKLCDEILPMISTNLTQKEITSLMLKAPNFLGVSLDQMTLPVEGTYGSMSGMDGRGMFAPDFDANAKLLQEFLYG